MAHLASNRFTYWGQLGILTAFVGAGLIIGGVASLIPLMGKVSLSDLSGGSSADFMNKFLKPENAGAFRWMQFISTLFLFFLPTVFYAWLCHKKPFLHLGMKRQTDIQQVIVVLLIMVAALPVVSLLQELTEMLPWSKSMLTKFKSLEDDYNRQVAVIARMENFGDYLVSVIMIAFLPAVFEEVLFRGGIQNLLSRWFKMPILAIIITSIIFSAIHMSILGFLSRFALGFILGWIYYRTGNLWLSILGHFFNNGLAITVLYFTSTAGAKTDPSKIEDHFPVWVDVVGFIILIGLFIIFEQLSKKYIDRPGEEELIPGVINMRNPFDDNTAAGNNI